MLEDKSLEYILAYTCVNINLGHNFPNGNKRSSLLSLYCLFFVNGILTVNNHDYLYNIAKDIAKGGSANREKSIADLKAFIVENKENI